MDRSLARPVAASLAAAFLFGASTPLAKPLLGELSPWTLAGWLYLGGAAGVAPLALAGGRARLDPADRGRLAGAVLLGGVLGPVLMLAALRSAPAGGISLLLNLESVATTVLAAAFFGEPLDRRALGALACIVLGSVVLAGPAGVVPASAAVFTTLACICWGFDNNWTATIGGLTPVRTTFVKGVVAGTTNLLVGRFAGGVPGGDMAPWTAVAAAVAVGMLGYGASIALSIHGAQHLGAGRSQLLFSTAPFFGLALATAFGREPLTGGLVAAGLAMAVGVVLLARSRHEHEHEHEAIEHVHHHRHDDGHHDHEHPGLPVGHAHSHTHRHRPLRHSHPHVPDLHHRHGHDREPGPA